MAQPDITGECCSSSALFLSRSSQRLEGCLGAWHRMQTSLAAVMVAGSVCESTWNGIISDMRRRTTESALDRTSPVAPRFYTLSDVATLLASTEAQVYALVRTGDLPAIKIGGRGQWRIEITVFDQWIADQYEATK